MTAEDVFWSLKDEARGAGIVPSRMGQLAKTCGDFSRATGLLRQALASKNPSTYLGALLKHLKAEIAPISSFMGEEPEIAIHGRLNGWPVRKTSLSDGAPAWWVAGTLYNKEGEDVGA